MMKKLFLLILSMIIVFSLVACNNNEGNLSSSGGSNERISIDKNSSSLSGNSNNSTNSQGSSSSTSGESSSGGSANEGNSSSQGSGDGVSTPQVGTSAQYLKAINDNNSSQTLIKTKFKTSGTIVADAIVTDFGADPTGKNDSTLAIQNALNAVKDLGGGTVFMPSGEYLVTSTITIPMFVSLVGDWNKPLNAGGGYELSSDFDYGTVILAKPSVLGRAAPKDLPLIFLNGDSGVVGLTFYYPEQNVENVKTYGYTIYADSPVTTTIRNVTFINSCYGIGVSLASSGNELVNLEKIYGTFLFNAIAHNFTSDVGFYDNLHVSTKFWLGAGCGYNSNNTASLNSFVNENLTALILGDLDDQLISNVIIDGGKIGIKFTTGIRADAGFWGVIYNANISCQTGVFADYLNSRSGAVFTNSRLGKIENNSSVGSIKLANSTFESAGTGRTILEGGNVKSEAISPLSLEFSNSSRMFVANNLSPNGKNDCSSALQNVLNSVGGEGGIVVIPNGVYRLNSTVTIPKNVEIRSTQSVFSRTNQSQNGKNGVVFVSYATGATLNLSEGAGVVGIRIWHAKNDFVTAKNALSNNSFTQDTSIKASGKNAYAYMNESVGAYIGYDFSACDNHILKSNYGISYLTFIKAGGKNGVINQCLANPNFMTRTNLYDYFDSSACIVDNWKKIRNSGETNQDFILLRDDIGRTFTKMVELENATGEVCLNVFCYGEAGLFNMKNSTATLVNTSLDFIPENKFVYELNGGECKIIGSLRVYGTSLKVNSGKMTAYGRIAFGEIKEKAYDSSVNLADEVEYVSSNAKRKVLFDCNALEGSFNVELNTSKNFVFDGNGSWKWKSTTLSGTFSKVDISEYKNGYLHFYVYCSDISKMGNEGQIEISSSSKCDVNEANWNVTQYITKTGWNEVWLDLFSAGTTGGEIDLKNVNFMRIYILNSSATFYIDKIEVVTD